MVAVAPLLFLLSQIAFAETRSDLFDRITVPAPEETAGPWRLLVHRSGSWESAPLDRLDDETGGTFYARARDLGPPAESPPEGARWRLVAASGARQREGFLVPAEAGQNGGAGPFRCDARTLDGPRFGLRFPGGAGFYRRLEVKGAPEPLIRAIRMELNARAGMFRIKRTDEDFRWSDVRCLCGTAVVRRRSMASVRSLFGYLDPRRQEALFTDDSIEEEVEIPLPGMIMSFAANVGLDNGFLLSPDAKVLLPSEPIFRPAVSIPDGAPYDWIVVASPKAGAFLHWLEVIGPGHPLGPVVYQRLNHRADGTVRSVELGYRFAAVEQKWRLAAPDGVVRLRQHVVLLGVPGETIALLADKDGVVEKIRRSMAAQWEPWVAKLEPVP